MKSLVEWVLSQRVFFEVLTFLVIAGGLVAALFIQKEDLPKISIPIVTVTTIYPGASPTDVEQQLTKKIEESLSGVDGLKKLTSVSAAGKSIVIAELDEDERSMDDFSSDINQAINSMSNLPVLEAPPSVQAVNSNFRPILQVFITGHDTEKIEAELELLKDKFDAIPGVAKINETGVLSQELLIELDTKKANLLRLDLNDIVAQVRAASSNTPAGELEDLENGKVFSLQSEPTAQRVEDYAKLAIKSPDTGQKITLGKIADLSIEKKDGAPTYLLNGKPAQGLHVVKNSKGDIVEISKAVKKIIADRQGELEYLIFNDSSERVVNRLNILTNNLLVGIILVIIVLSLVLPFKIALIVAMGIPVSTLGALLIMEYLGISLNMLTMMGFIIAIGIVVDDAIVFVESCYERLEHGLSKQDAVIEGVSRVFWPVTVSVLTTMVSFGAIFFIPGLIGKFAFYLPISVIFSLFLSLVEGLTILPVHFFSWISVQTASMRKAKFWEKVKSWYGKFLLMTLKGRYFVLCGYLGLLFFSVKFMSESQFVLFPTGEIASLELQIQLEENVSKKKSSAIAKTLSLQAKEKFHKEITMIRSTIGKDWDSKLPDSSRLIVDVELAEDYDSRDTAILLGSELKAYIQSQESVQRVVVKPIQDGPPLGEAFQLTARGKDFGEIEKAIELAKEYLKGIKGVKEIRENSYVQKSYEVKLDNSLMSKVGLNTSDLSLRLNQHLNGSIAGNFTHPNSGDIIDIRVQGKSRSIDSIEQDFKMKNNRGNFIPFNKVGSLHESQSRNAINHYKKQREITLYADVDNKNITSTSLNQKAQEYVANNLQPKFPNIYFSFEGEESERIHSLNAVYANFFIVAAVILMLLLLQFRTFMYPLLVALTIPFCVCGVALTFYFHNEPISFLALLGGLALAGVVVNDSIVMLDRLKNIRLSNDFVATNSIVVAAKERFRPIMLTTITTFLGVIPTAYGIGGMDKFVQPVALSLGWGIIVATVLVLLILPVMVRVLDDLSILFKKLTGKTNR